MPNLMEGDNSLVVKCLKVCICALVDAVGSSAMPDLGVY